MLHGFATDDLWEGNEGVTGLPNLTRHTNLVRSLDPHHLTLRNEGPIDTLTYQNHDSCKAGRPLGFRDMCYATYRYSKPAWHNSSDAWGSQMYPYPVSPEVTNHTQGMWSTGLNTQVMNLSGSLCTFPQDQFCRETHPHTPPSGDARERCGCKAGTILTYNKTKPYAQTQVVMASKRTSVWPIIQVFGWQTYGSSINCEHWGLNVSGSKFPSLDIMRCMSFQAIANGANGLQFYSLMDQFRGHCCSGATKTAQGLCVAPTAEEVEGRLQTLESLGSELKALTPTLLSPTVSDGTVVLSLCKAHSVRHHNEEEEEEDGQCGWPDVQWIAKQSSGGGGEITLIVVNAMEVASGTPGLGAAVDVEFIVAGVAQPVKLSLDPYGVKVQTVGGGA